MRIARLTLAATLVLACGVTNPPRQPLSAEQPSSSPLAAKLVDAKLACIDAVPAEIELKHAYDYAQIVLTGHLEDGDTIDVTRFAMWTLPKKLVTATPDGIVRPLADGEGEIVAELNGKSVKIPVKVSGQKDAYEVDFIRDVMPVLSKLGCNAGTCHGAQQGKNGFKLSLRGYNPEFDHIALTDDLEGRRFNRAAPEKSLMLMKPAGAVPHMGGVLMKPGDPYYELIKAWIAAGVKFKPDTKRVKSIEVLPKNLSVSQPGMTQQLSVIATLPDGTTRDVTAEAIVESGNTEVATVDRNGLVTAVRRGEAAMLARYEGAYAAATLVVMGDRSGFAWKDTPTYNYIDVLVNQKLKAVKVQPSELCTDAEFLRRIYLDLIGLPPQPEDVRKFLSNERPTRLKREELIDRLIGSEDFIEHWTNKWADLLQVNRKFLGNDGAKALRDWIRKAIADNMPYDRFAHAVLTASGSNIDNPPAAYYKVLRDPGTTMENTTQLFLAIRFNCNKCHDHPFERWTQEQYYHLAAFFARVGRKPDPKFGNQKIGGTAVEGALPLVEIISDEAAGEIKHERTGQVAAPEFPFSHSDLAPETAPRREQLAKWITSKESPYFAKSYVNRLWSYLLGVGIIDPVDDIRAGNPPSNPKLLDRLTKEFTDSGFDTRKVLADICKSATYQRSFRTNEWNRDDEINYSHAVPRRLTAEVLYDAIHRATGSQSRLPGLPPGARAAQLLDSAGESPTAGGFLDLFGKPPRESACECERSGGMMLGPVLSLVNGPVLAGAVRDPNNRLAKLIAAEKDNRKVVEEIFLAIRNRPPTEKELERSLAAFDISDEEFAEIVKESERRTKALADREELIASRYPEWEKAQAGAANWTTLDLTETKSAGGAGFKKLPDGSYLLNGKKPAKDTYTLAGTSRLAVITAIRLEVLPDASLPARGPGRGGNGNFVLSEITLQIAPKGDAAEAKPAPFGRAVASFSQDLFAVAGAIDGNATSGWAIAPRFGQPHTAVFEFKEPITLDEGDLLLLTLDQQHGAEHTIGRFRLSLTTANPPITLVNLPEHIVELLSLPADDRTGAQQAVLAQYHRGLDRDLPKLIEAAAEMPKPTDKRLLAAQDLAWALVNSPAFLFNH